MGLVFFLGFGEGARPWELVVHFGEWTTSSVGEGGKGRKPGEMGEPVDHFGEWTTSWGEKGGKWLETGGRGGASGPL